MAAGMVSVSRWIDRLRRQMRAAGRRGQPEADADIHRLLDLLIQSDSAGERARAAQAFLARFSAADEAGLREIVGALCQRYDVDTARLGRAIAAYAEGPGADSLVELHAASEPRRQILLRRLNEAPGGTRTLLAMRAAALRMGRDQVGAAALDADFSHILSSWFNSGFLELRRLDWSTSGDVLSRLIEHEAVHAIGSWEELRARLQPEDRRCYALFHPAMPAEPLIFTEVALTAGIAANVDEVLRCDRATLDPSEATTAVFYSISNCQDGLRGIPFGGLLIGKVARLLREELPRLRETVTLSPIPGFARWLRRRAGEDAGAARLCEAVAETGWWDDDELSRPLRAPLLRLAALYLTGSRGRDADPVARFHLGNGARVEQLNWLGTRSPRGLDQSHGLMVNYLYDSDSLEARARLHADGGPVATSGAVRRLLRGPGPKWWPIRHQRMTEGATR